MIKTLYGPHATFTHTDGQDMGAIKAMQPAVVKVFENVFTSFDLLEELYRNLPDALIIMRDWPLSEQKSDMARNPEETGKRHADEWAQKVTMWKERVPSFDQKRTLVLGINEPAVWAVLDQTVRYYTAFAHRLTDHRIRGGLLSLSVGWPANTGPDTAANWQPYETVHTAMKRGLVYDVEHVVVLHEYWYTQGPDHMWKWWAGRYLWCPWQVPIILGECGIDSGVDHAGPHLGWQSFISKEQYIEQLRRYEDLLRQDPRIIGATPFTYDYGSREWATFDVRPIRWELVEYAKSRQPWVRKPLNGGLPQPQPPAPQPPAPTPEQIMWQKICWAFEETARRVRGEGYSRAHDWLVGCESYRYALSQRDK